MAGWLLSRGVLRRILSGAWVALGVACGGLATLYIHAVTAVPRLARASRDWYQLLEVCAVFATLLGDLDGIYDLTSYNDR